MNVPSPGAEVELLLCQQITAEQEHGLRADFTGWGYPVRTRRALPHRGPEQLGWLVLVALPLHAFLAGLGTEAVSDAYQGLKRLASRLPRSRGPGPGRDRPGVLVLQDARSELRVVLEADLPVRAYQQLLELDLSDYRFGPLHYDRTQARWRSELDEAAAAADPGAGPGPGPGPGGGPGPDAAAGSG